MVLDATRHYAEALGSERLFGWHAALFPTGYSGLSKITAGQYRDDRDGPMQVVSGGVGRERVHFEAPPAAHLADEMQRFLTWFNTNDHSDPLIKAGLAHFWFVTLHPFEDGNGRIGRAVCDMALAKADASVQRFYSLSAQIQRERNDYYDALERAQKSTLDITGWLAWFFGCLLRAIKGSGEVLQSTLSSANLWKQWEGIPMNARQVLMLKKLLHHFEGNLTSSKWAKIAKTSPDTALRDIKDLVAKGVLVEAEAGGRSTHYLLK
jgi:Fic family protein